MYENFWSSCISIDQCFIILLLSLSVFPPQGLGGWGPAGSGRGGFTPWKGHQLITGSINKIWLVSFKFLFVYFFSSMFLNLIFDLFLKSIEWSVTIDLFIDLFSPDQSVLGEMKKQRDAHLLFPIWQMFVAPFVLRLLSQKYKYHNVHVTSCVCAAILTVVVCRHFLLTYFQVDNDLISDGKTVKPAGRPGASSWLAVALQQQNFKSEIISKNNSTTSLNISHIPVWFSCLHNTWMIHDTKKWCKMKQI